MFPFMNYLLVLSLLIVGGSARKNLFLRSKSTLDVNQKVFFLDNMLSILTVLNFKLSKFTDSTQQVYIENQPVLGGRAGDGALNQCRSFAHQHVTKKDSPRVEVCGTGTLYFVRLKL